MSVSSDRGPYGRRMLGRLFRFVVIGVVMTALAYAIFLPLLAYLRPAAAVGGAWVICVVVGYLLHRRFTFRSEGQMGRELPLFVAGSLLQLAVAAIGIELLIGAGLNATVAFLINTAVTTVVSFGFQSLVTFKRRR